MLSFEVNKDVYMQIAASVNGSSNGQRLASGERLTTRQLIKGDCDDEKAICSARSPRSL